MSISRLLISIAIMAGITYLIRILPISIFRKEINSKFIRSFLYYVPYAVLASLTFPAIFYGTDSHLTAVVGTVAAMILAYFDRGLVLVAAGAVAGAFIFSLFIS